MAVFFAEGIYGGEYGSSREVVACAVEVFVEGVLLHQLFAAKEVEVCSGRGCAGKVFGRSMWSAVGVVRGELDECAVFVDDCDVGSEVVGDEVVGAEVGVKIPTIETQHLQRVDLRVADTAAKHVAVAVIRAQGRAPRAAGSHPGGDGCHGCLVGRVQVVAEGIPAQKLPVAALEVVLRRVAVSIPPRVANERYVSILCLPFHRSICHLYSDSLTRWYMICVSVIAAIMLSRISCGNS